MSHFGPVVAVNNGLKVIFCLSCNYHHLNPLPTEKQINDLYQTDKFYSENGRLWFEKEKQEHLAGLWNSAYTFQRRLLDSQCIIDVGTGSGWFVQWANLNGIAWGVEPSYLARHSGPCASRIFDRLEDLSALEFFNNCLSVSMRASLLLEHVLNPVETLQQMLPYFDKRLLVIVPNEFNPLQAKLGGSWFVTKHHLNYWTGKTLEYVLNQAGLKVVWKGSTAPIELFAMAGLDYRKKQRTWEYVS